MFKITEDDCVVNKEQEEKMAKDRTSGHTFKEWVEDEPTRNTLGSRSLRKGQCSRK